MDALLYRTRKVDLEAFLSENHLFYDFETVIGKIILLEEDRKIEYSADLGGSFVNEVIHRFVDEAGAFLGCLKQGYFYAALHHSRALIELYATTKYCLSEEGQKNEVFELFDKYIILMRHIWFLEIDEGKNVLDFTESNKQYFREKYSTLDPAILATFKYKDIEAAKKKLKKSFSWLNTVIKPDDLLKKAGSVRYNNYEKLCHYAHFSPLPERAKRIMFGLPHWWEEMLVISAKDSFDCYAFLRDTSYLSESTKKSLDDVFSILVGSLLPRVKSLLDKNSRFEMQK